MTSTIASKKRQPLPAGRNVPESEWLEWYAKWERQIRTTIRNFFPSDPQTCEDTFQDFMAEWYGRNYLGFYDPAKGAMSSFMYAVLIRRVLSAYRRMRTHSRFDALLDTLDYNGIGFDPYEQLEFTPPLQLILKQLEQLPIRGKRDLPRLMRDLYSQIVASGEKNQNVLAKAYGISPTAVSMQVADLRQALIDGGFVIKNELDKWEWTMPRLVV